MKPETKELKTLLARAAGSLLQRQRGDRIGQVRLSPVGASVWIEKDGQLYALSMCRREIK